LTTALKNKGERKGEKKGGREGEGGKSASSGERSEGRRGLKWMEERGKEGSSK